MTLNQLRINRVIARAKGNFLAYQAAKQLVENLNQGIAQSVELILPIEDGVMGGRLNEKAPNIIVANYFTPAPAEVKDTIKWQVKYRLTVRSSLVK